MNSDGSVTHWIHEIKVGDSIAAQQLWQRYFARLVRLARSELRGGNRRMADEEDVALNVFDKFCRAAESGRFPNLADCDALWRLLVRMTANQAIDQLRDRTPAQTDTRKMPRCRIGIISIALRPSNCSSGKRACWQPSITQASCRFTTLARHRTIHPSIMSSRNS